MQGQVFSEANCAGVINNLVTNLINQYQTLESDFANQRVEIFKASSTLNGVSYFSHLKMSSDFLSFCYFGSNFPLYFLLQ